jgi:hypothetical protein
MTKSPSFVSARTSRSTSSIGNWQGWIVFSTWLCFTFGMTQTSPGFLPSGLHVLPGVRSKQRVAKAYGHAPARAAWEVALDLVECQF